MIEENELLKIMFNDQWYLITFWAFECNNNNTNKVINIIIQMNQGEIIQYFINNKEHLEILFLQLKVEEDILI